MHISPPVCLVAHSCQHPYHMYCTIVVHIHDVHHVTRCSWSPVCRVLGNCRTGISKMENCLALTKYSVPPEGMLHLQFAISLNTLWLAPKYIVYSDTMVETWLSSHPMHLYSITSLIYFPSYIIRLGYFRVKFRLHLLHVNFKKKKKGIQIKGHHFRKLMTYWRAYIDVMSVNTYLSSA